MRAVDVAVLVPRIHDQGETKRYTAYHCGRSVDRICPNTTGCPKPGSGKRSWGWFETACSPPTDRRGRPISCRKRTGSPPLLARIQSELDRQADGQTDRRPALQSEITRLEQQITGWKMSLGNPSLGAEIRGALEADLGTALVRLRALNAELATVSATATDARLLADPAAVADRLNRFTEVLAFDNPSRLNLELALHIDAIRCFPDGRVVVRTCQLGGLSRRPRRRWSRPGKSPHPLVPTTRLSTPRKRSIRRLQTEDAGPSLREAAHRAADVNQFAGLGSEWFWEDEFRIPEPTCWSKENAAAVARPRAEGRTHEELADQFGVTVLTIRKALQISEQSDSGAGTATA